MILRLYTYTLFYFNYIVLTLIKLDYSPVYIYTSLTFLNSSVEARAFNSSDSTLFIITSGGRGLYLILKDLTMFKNS